jgi:hypothetical protein
MYTKIAALLTLVTVGAMGCAVGTESGSESDVIEANQSSLTATEALNKQNDETQQKCFDTCQANSSTPPGFYSKSRSYCNGLCRDAFAAEARRIIIVQNPSPSLSEAEAQALNKKNTEALPKCLDACQANSSAPPGFYSKSKSYCNGLCRDAFAAEARRITLGQTSQYTEAERDVLYKKNDETKRKCFDTCQANSSTPPGFYSKSRNYCDGLCRDAFAAENKRIDGI